MNSSLVTASCLAGVADGGAKEHAVLLQQIHGAHNLVVGAVTAARIVGLGALDGIEHDVAQTLALRRRTAGR